MNKHHVKRVTIQRVKQLFDSYGAEPNNWPENERAAAVMLLEESSELKALQQEAKELDAVLHINEFRSTSHCAENSDLVSRIISDLPSQDVVIEANSNAQRFSSPSNISWRARWGYAVAAGFALFCVTILFNGQQSESIEGASFVLDSPDVEQWMWQEVTGEAFLNDSEELTYMAMIELE